MITQIGRGHARGHVVEEAGELGREPDRRVGGAHPVEILRPALLRELEPAAQVGRQQAPAPPARTSLKTRAPWLPPRTRRRKRSRRPRRGRARRELRPHRVAGEQPLQAGPGGARPRSPRSSGRRRARTVADQAVGPAEHRVLLVHEQRHPAERPRPAPPAPRHSRRRPRPPPAGARRKARRLCDQAARKLAQAAQPLAAIPPDGLPAATTVQGSSLPT